MARRPHDLALPDLAGRRALVTGGSDGMGLVIAARLAAAGAEVVLPVRNPAKGEAALRTVRDRVPGAAVSLRELDLSSLASVAALGQTLLEEGDPVHVLVGNAGVMTPPQRQTTEDGVELQLGTNHLGHAALVGHLLPLLRAGRARVVLQLSVAARRGAVHWEDPSWERSYDGMAAYRSSKIAYGLYGLELDRRSRAGGWGLTVALSHPGVAPTNLLAARPEIGRARAVGARRPITLLSRLGVLGTVESAALPAVLAATTPDPGPGAFYGPQGPGGLGGPPGPVRLFGPLRSAQDARRAWELTHALAGLAAPA